MPTRRALATVATLALIVIVGVVFALREALDPTGNQPPGVRQGFGPVESTALILDTDVGNDVDDAMALALVHALAARGEVELLAVMISNPTAWAAPFIDLVNTFYGRGDTPIGLVSNRDLRPPKEMIRGPVERRLPDGSPAYPHDVLLGDEVPEAVALYRSILADQPDSSVIIVQVGPSTNLADLLVSLPGEHSPLSGRQLVEEKVRLLSVMAGDFSRSYAEHNVVEDVPAAQRVFTEWPTPVVASGFEVGISIWYPVSSIRHHMGYVQRHPVAEAFVNYYEVDRSEAPADQATFDLTSALYAVRPADGYFGLSQDGQIVVADDGTTRFVRGMGGRHRHLTVTPDQRRRVLEAMVYLVSQPPSGR